MSLIEGTYTRNPDEALYCHSLSLDKPWQDGETKWEACVVIEISIKRLVALGQNASHVMSRRPAGRNIRNRALQLKRTWTAIIASSTSQQGAPWRSKSTDLHSSKQDREWNKKWRGALMRSYFAPSDLNFEIKETWEKGEDRRPVHSPQGSVSTTAPKERTKKLGFRATLDVTKKEFVGFCFCYFWWPIQNLQ